MRSTNNEARVERNRSLAGTMELPDSADLQPDSADLQSVPFPTRNINDLITPARSFFDLVGILNISNIPTRF